MDCRTTNAGLSPTCDWSASPVDWTWFLPGSDAGRRCSSLSSCVVSRGPLLETHILYSLCLHDSHTHTHTAQPPPRRESQHLTHVPVWCHCEERQGNGTITHHDDGQRGRVSLNSLLTPWRPCDECACQPDGLQRMQVLCYLTRYRQFSSGPMQKCRAMTPWALSVSRRRGRECKHCVLLVSGTASVCPPPIPPSITWGTRIA